MVWTHISSVQSRELKGLDLGCVQILIIGGMLILERGKKADCLLWVAPELQPITPWRKQRMQNWNYCLEPAAIFMPSGKAEYCKVTFS